MRSIDARKGYSGSICLDQYSIVQRNTLIIFGLESRLNSHVLAFFRVRVLARLRGFGFVTNPAEGMKRRLVS